MGAMAPGAEWEQVRMNVRRLAAVAVQLWNTAKRRWYVVAVSAAILTSDPTGTVSYGYNSLGDGETIETNYKPSRLFDAGWIMEEMSEADWR
jgi:hypothetical protein